MCPMTEVSAPSGELVRRRASVFDALGDGVMVLPAAPIQHASRDTERPYVPDRELFYLTGLVEPGCVAVLVGGSKPRMEVFARSRDPEAELWSGPRLGLEGVQRKSGADEVYPIEEVSTRLPALLGDADKIHVRLGCGGVIEHAIVGALETARARGARQGTGPRGVIDPGEILDDLRLVKSEHELSLIREACRITMEGHRAAAQVIAQGVGEWAIEAELERAFRAAGATGPGFESIVGGGENTCVLHYVSNNVSVPEGALVLIDAGAEFGLYHGDVTRTYPANGRFTEEQRAVYEVVDRARDAGIAAVRPAATIGDVHDVSTRVLVEGLIDLGVLSGAVDEALEEGAHRDFFPHRTSHWLGLDVHDPGDYARLGASRVLEPGMVFTIEPGLYFRPALCDGRVARWAGIGIRVEDDVVVTADGAEVLTADLPTAAAEVEGLVGS